MAALDSVGEAAGVEAGIPVQAVRTKGTRSHSRLRGLPHARQSTPRCAVTPAESAERFDWALGTTVRRQVSAKPG